MPGSGKTTVGQGLARDLDYIFIDTDEFIEQELAKKSIEKIFEEEGEEAFRRFEKAVLHLQCAYCVADPAGNSFLLSAFLL